MNKRDIFIGFLLGLLGGFIGCFVVLHFFTAQGFVEGFKILRQGGMIGKVITLGSILNLIIFFILIQKKKDLMARGVILAMFLLTILTLLL